jgi:hypothetical protein
LSSMFSVVVKLTGEFTSLEEPTDDSDIAIDEVLTRQCLCLGLSIHGAYVGAWRIRRLQTETGVRTNLPRFGPPEGKDLHPACLILYCWYMWSCYNGTQMQSGRGGRRWRALAYAWDLCEIRCLCEIVL